MATTLGVPTLSYLPWAILCYTGVIFAIIWGFTGFGIAKIKPATIIMRNIWLFRKKTKQHKRCPGRRFYNGNAF